MSVKACNTRIEATVSVTLQPSGGVAVSFQKTGYGESEADAQTDAQKQLEADRYYKLLVAKGSEVVM